VSDYPDYSYPTVFRAQDVGVWTSRDWAEKTGEGINQFGMGTDPGDGTGITLVDYTVPTGKTLYIDEVWGGIGYLGVPTYVYMTIYNFTTGLVEWLMGGVGGVGMAFTKPRRYTAGTRIKINFYQHSGRSFTVGGGFHGRLL